MSTEYSDEKRGK